MAEKLFFLIKMLFCWLYEENSELKPATAVRGAVDKVLVYKAEGQQFESSQVQDLNWVEGSSGSGG
jgi:hypothetical protein